MQSLADLYSTFTRISCTGRPDKVGCVWFDSQKPAALYTSVQSNDKPNPNTHFNVGAKGGLSGTRPSVHTQGVAVTLFSVFFLSVRIWRRLERVAECEVSVGVCVASTACAVDAGPDIPHHTGLSLASA